MTTDRLSVQLYTVREALEQDLPGTLRRLASMGLTQVEPYGLLSMPGLGPALESNNLRSPTAHANLLVPEQDSILEYAQGLGVETVIVPFTPPGHWTSAQDISEIARQINAAASRASGFGLRVGYHNHAHELESTVEERTGLEVFAENLDPDVVLEIDTYWAAVGGRDPIRLLEHLAPRIVAIHLKDGPITKNNLDQTAVGDGSMPIGAILAMVPHALQVIELDDYRGDRFDAIQRSVRFLRGQPLP